MDNKVVKGIIIGVLASIVVRILFLVSPTPELLIGLFLGCMVGFFTTIFAFETSDDDEDE